MSAHTEGTTSYNQHAALHFRHIPAYKGSKLATLTVGSGHVICERVPTTSKNRIVAHHTLIVPSESLHEDRICLHLCIHGQCNGSQSAKEVGVEILRTPKSSMPRVGTDAMIPRFILGRRCENEKEAKFSRFPMAPSREIAPTAPRRGAALPGVPCQHKIYAQVHPAANPTR